MKHRSKGRRGEKLVLATGGREECGTPEVLLEGKRGKRSKKYDSKKKDLINEQ